MAKPEYPEQVGQGRTRPPSPDGSEQRTEDADQPVTGRGDSTPPASGEAEGLSRSELKRRAGAGLFVVGSWGLIRLAVQFAGNLALARLLTPRDFGIVAIGLTVLLIGRSISDGGMASALIRASEEPTREQLGTLTGIQLLLTTAIAAVGIPVALQFGLAGQVTALMLLTLPLSALRSAPSVRLTRQLRFRELSAADGISLVAQYGVSLLLVAFGFGVWALAFGGVASTAGLVAGLAIIAPRAFVRPSLSRAGEFGPVIRFGISFQASWILSILREQGVMVATGALAGVATLGRWSLATKLMLLPDIVYRTISQVTFPAMTHALNTEKNPRALVERMSRLGSMASTFAVAPFVAAAPGLVPALFGPRWADTALALPGAGAATLVSTSVMTATLNYLFIANRPDRVFRAMLASALITGPACVVLIPAFGIAGVGATLFVIVATEAAMLARYTHQLTGARFERHLARVFSVAAVAATAGWLVTVEFGSDFAAGVAGAIVALMAVIGGLALTSRSDLADLLSMARFSGREGLRSIRMRRVRTSP